MSLIWLQELRGTETQDSIASKAGISRSAYANIENGNRKPSVIVAKRIANALGFNWTLFFEDKSFDSKHKTG